MAKLKDIFSSVSHDHLEIILICWYAAQETFVFFMNRKIKRAAYLKSKYFVQL